MAIAQDTVHAVSPRGRLWDPRSWGVQADLRGLPLMPRSFLTVFLSLHLGDRPCSSTRLTSTKGQEPQESQTTARECASE